MAKSLSADETPKRTGRFTSPNVAALNAGHAKAVMQTKGEIIASALWLRRILQAPLQRLELLGYNLALGARACSER